MKKPVQSTASSTISKANFFSKLAFESEYIQKHTSLNYNTSI